MCLDLSAASSFGHALPSLGARMEAEAGSLMVASSDGRDTRHASCDALWVTQTFARLPYMEVGISEGQIPVITAW